MRSFPNLELSSPGPHRHWRGYACSAVYLVVRHAEGWCGYLDNHPQDGQPEYIGSVRTLAAMSARLKTISDNAAPKLAARMRPNHNEHVVAFHAHNYRAGCADAGRDFWRS